MQRRNRAWDGRATFFDCAPETPDDRATSGDVLNRLLEMLRGLSEFERLRFWSRLQEHPDFLLASNSAKGG